MKTSFKLGLLHLLYLVTNCDDDLSHKEITYLNSVLANNDISEHLLNTFRQSLNNSSHEELYRKGIALLNKCSEEYRLRAIGIIYQMAKSDGQIHPREERLMLNVGKSIFIEPAKVLQQNKTNNFFAAGA